MLARHSEERLALLATEPVLYSQTPAGTARDVLHARRRQRNGQVAELQVVDALEEHKALTAGLTTRRPCRASNVASAPSEMP
jgi:hypothetical protein